MARKKKRRVRVKKRKSLFSVLKSKYFWLSLFFLALVSGGVYLLFIHPLFQIEKMVVSGNEEVGEEEIQKVAEVFIWKEFKAGPFHLFRTKSIFLFSLNNASREIKNKFPQVGEAKLKRGLPDTISINITEREPFAEVCDEEGRCFKVDKEGVAFKESARLKEGGGEAEVFKIKKEDLVLTLKGGPIELGDIVIASSYLKEARTIQERMRNDFKVGEESLIVSEDNTLVLKSSRGFSIYFDLEGNVSDQLFNLDLVLREKIPEEKMVDLEYIDLRFGNRVYYK